MKKLIFILFIITLNGCYNYKELNEIAIISAIGIDKNNDDYIITLQVINPQIKEENKEKYIIYKGNGKTIKDALNDAAKSISKSIYLNSVEILLINKEIAKNNIYDILETFYNENKINNLLYILITKDNSEKILSLSSPLYDISSKKIKEILVLDSEYYKTSKIVTLEELLNNYLSNKEYILPSIYIDNNINENTIKLGPLCLFKNNKMTNCFNKKEINYGEN